MLIEPSGINRSALKEWLADCYQLRIADLCLMPVGADSFNYHAIDTDLRSWFVNCRRSAPVARLHGDLAALERSYHVAWALRDAAGLSFLSCPIPSRTDTLASSFGGLPVSVFPFLEGRAGWAETSEEQTALLASVRALHNATPVVRRCRPSVETFEPTFEFPLTKALARVPNLDASVGPFAARLKRSLAAHHAYLLERLARFHALRSAVLAEGPADWVITHGEPAWNVIWGPSGHTIVDCGELWLAPPERDLFLFENAGGRPDRRELYDLRWLLSEVAEYATQFSEPHSGTAEDERAWADLVQYLPY